MQKKILLTLIFLCFASCSWATDWYVRQNNGDYGNEDGTTYADAWDGLMSVVWGGAGVIAGDTLYVCGTNIYPHTPHSSPYTKVDITVSGNDEDSRIIIRGDYPGDAGTIWGNYVIGGTYSEWTDEGDNVYSTASSNTVYGYFYFENITGTWDLLTKANTLQDCRDTPGSYYSATYTYPNPVYFHCSDNGAPDLRVSSPMVGYHMYLTDRQFITFLNIDFYSPYFAEMNGGYIRWEGCKLWYMSAGFLFADNAHHMEIIDCDRAYGGGGIGFRDNVPYGNAPNNVTISGCKIHDIGIYVQNVDAEGIGANGLDDSIIEHNEFYNCGSAFTTYPYTNQSSENVIIRWNYIHDTHSIGGARDRGIEINMSGANSMPRSGYQVYGNIVGPGVDGDGYRSTFDTYEVIFYNNIAYGCDYSFYFDYVYSAEKGPNIRLRNNISMNPKTLHIYFGSQTTDANYVIDSDYNLFYPDGAAFFRLKDLGGQTNTDFAGWQSLSKAGCTFDPNSILDDPNFISPGGGVFNLNVASPAIDTGIDVGLTEDFIGTAVPQNTDFDIGAYEYIYGVSTQYLIANLFRRYEDE